MTAKRELQARTPEGAGNAKPPRPGGAGPGLPCGTGKGGKSADPRQRGRPGCQPGCPENASAHCRGGASNRPEVCANASSGTACPPCPLPLPEQLTKVGEMFGQPVPCVPPPPPMEPGNPPQGLASQLLTPAGEPLKHPCAVATAVRQGRSPVAKRKLPARGGEAEYQCGQNYYIT